MHASMSGLREVHMIGRLREEELRRAFFIVAGDHVSLHACGSVTIAALL